MPSRLCKSRLSSVTQASGAWKIVKVKEDLRSGTLSSRNELLTASVSCLNLTLTVVVPFSTADRSNK